MNLKTHRAQSDRVRVLITSVSSEASGKSAQPRRIAKCIHKVYPLLAAYTKGVNGKKKFLRTHRQVIVPENKSQVRHALTKK